MAGAIYHEINQPLQAITARALKQIKYQATRIGDIITKRLSKLTRYKTIPYPGDTKIVDIWGGVQQLKKGWVLI